MAAAAPKPEDRLAFADELAQVRAKDVDGEYKKELDELEVEYQFILLRSLVLFHKEMLRAKLPESLNEIKEKFTDTVGTFTYQTNLPTTNWNWNNIICKQCRKTSLKPMPTTNELCCEICGVLQHWMAPTLMMKNSISAAMISRSLNNDTPGENTTSCVTWKIKEKSSQQTDIHCPLKQLIKPMRSSRELKNICQSESRRRL